MFDYSKSSFGNDEFLIDDDKYNFNSPYEDKMMHWDKIIHPINFPSFHNKIDEELNENQDDMHSKTCININNEFDVITSTKKELEILNKLEDNIEKQGNHLEEHKEESISTYNKQSSFKILDFNDNILDQRQDKDSSGLVLGDLKKENDVIPYLKKLLEPSHANNPEKFK